MAFNSRQQASGPSFGAIFGWVFAGIIGIVAITIIGGSWYTVGQYQRGIITQNGAFVKVVQPGLGFKWPWFQSIELIDMRTTTITWDNMETYSHDQQPTHLKISVTVAPREDKLQVLYTYFQTLAAAKTALLNPVVPKYTKIVFGDYTSTMSIQQRGKLNTDIEKAIVGALEQSVFLVQSVNVEDIAFGKSYLDSIDSRMRAEVKVSEFRQDLEKEKVAAEIVKTKALGAAEAAKAKADGEAYATRATGNAEAEAIKARSKALSENPSYIQMLQAERWDGKLPTTMVPNGSLPMMNVGK